MGLAVTVLCAAGILLASDQAMQAASAAAQIFAAAVMPALFPMMVISRLLPVQDNPVFSALFGFASGSPAAAQRLRLLHDAGMSSERTERLAALTGVMSPMFFTGTLARWTGGAQNGWMLLAVHWTSAAVTALLWRPAKGSPKPAADVQTGLREPLLRRLPSVVAQSAQALLSVCGAMMLFSIAAALLRAALTAAFPVWTEGRAPELAVLWALMEIGGGASAVTQLWPEPPLALLSGLCGFGGLSLWMQNLLFLEQSIRPARLLGMRMLHGAIAYGLGVMLF